MPGSIHISATQPPATPMFLQVDVGRKEYSGNIEQDGLSFPVTSLKENMVIMLYNADRELISKTELKTKTIVESGTTDIVFTLDSGEVIFQLQFLLSDDDRKRIQEMRNSAMKRKQHELPGDGNEFNFPDSPLSKRLIEKISSIKSKGDETKLRKNLSLNDLQEDRAIFPGINVESYMKASREDDLLPQSGIKKFEDPNGSKEEHGKPKISRSSSAVKKMISAFESTSLSSGHKEREKAIVPSVADKDWKDRSRIKPGENGVPNASSNESRRLGPSGARKQKVRGEHDEHDLSRSKRKHRRSIGRFSLEKLSSSRSYLEHHPLNYLVATSSTWLHPHICVTTASRQLKVALELEHRLSIKHADKSETGEKTGEARKNKPQVLHLNGWWINQGVRAAIAVIACGALFLNR